MYTTRNTPTHTKKLVFILFLLPSEIDIEYCVRYSCLLYIFGRQMDFFNRNYFVFGYIPRRNVYRVVWQL